MWRAVVRPSSQGPCNYGVLLCAVLDARKVQRTCTLRSHAASSDPP